MSLTRVELDKAHCDVPGCTEDHGPLFLHARCHQEAYLQVAYHDGLVKIYCGVCSTEVTSIEVAEK